MAGFGDLLTRQATSSLQGDLTVEAWNTKKDLWTKKQERACAAIQNCLGYNTRSAIEDLTTVSTILAKVKTRFRPTGSTVFSSLDRRYQKLTLFDCENVMASAEKLRQARNELLELDANCKIGDPHFVRKFLSGLGPRFDIFLTTFNQTHSLIPLASADDQVEVRAVTFDEAVMAADKEEKRMTAVEDQSNKTVAFVSNLTRPTDNKVTVTVPYYTHYKKNYHTVNNCWDLHPELRRAANKKRKNGKAHLQKPKRSKPTEEDDEPTFEEPSVHFMATTVPASSIAPRSSKGLWILDTGCSQHITSRQADFINLEPYSGGPILGIGNTQLAPKGQGTVKVPCKVSGRRVIMLLSNALWYPDVGVSLISVSQLL